MKYLIGIPYVIGAEFTKRALASLGKYQKNAIVCDCSENEQDRAPIPVHQEWQLDRPIVPLGFTQTMNYFQQLAIRRGCEALLYMHNDAEASERTVEGLLELAEQLSETRPKWGVLFTNYDAFACFNVEMFAEIGPWDARVFPFPYYADNDYYRRVELAGWELIDTGLPCLHHGSHSLKISPRYKFLNDLTFGIQANLFAAKWGAHPNKPEKLWKRPFNGKLDCLPSAQDSDSVAVEDAIRDAT